MVSAIKQNGIVGKEGRLELLADLPEGTKVEVIILIEEQDETEYLLSTEANRQHLMEAIKEVGDQKSYIYIDPKTL